MDQIAGGLPEPFRPFSGSLFRLMLASKREPMPEFLRPFDAAWFDACTVCDTDLPAAEDGYLVIKNFRGREVIYELGLCMACAEQLGASYSEESRAAIDGLFAEVGWIDQALTRQAAPPDDWATALTACALTGQSRDEFDEYQIVAACDGRDMMVNLFPYVIGTRGIEQITARLSQATQDTWDRFVGDHLGLPPELRSLPI